MTGCRVHNQTRGLIQHQDMLIFKHNIEWNLFGFVLFNHGDGRSNHNLLTAVELIARANHLAVDGKLTLFNPTLNARARIVGK